MKKLQIFMTNLHDFIKKKNSKKICSTEFFQAAMFIYEFHSFCRVTTSPEYNA